MAHDASAAQPGAGAEPPGGAAARRVPRRRRPPRLGRGKITVPPGDADRLAYRERLLAVSRALVLAQREIRILRALHWPDSVADRFFEKGARELPTPPLVPLGFDPREKEARFLEIEARLDPGDPLQEVLRQTALQYVEVVKMLEARGTKEFHEISARLYGHPLEPFSGQSVTNLDLARHFDQILDPRSCRDLTPPPRYDIPAEDAARLLERRFRRAFPGVRVRVEVASNLTADAAAGADRIRVKRGRLFGKDTLDYLEQHEGYVHVATTVNGREQPWLPILGKASPRATRVNEGLAVFGEWASHTLTVARVRRLVDRVLAIRMAEEGADFLQVYRAFLDRGEPPPAAFDISRRVFRGGDVRGGAPFTKDSSYLGDFLRIFNFARVALKRRCLGLLDLLFVGKVTVQDLPVLSERLRTGEVAPPRFLPAWCADKNWLASHMALSSFLNLIELARTEEFYEDVFSRCLAAGGPVSVSLASARPRGAGKS